VKIVFEIEIGRFIFNNVWFPKYKIHCKFLNALITFCLNNNFSP